MHWVSYHGHVMWLLEAASELIRQGLNRLGRKMKVSIMMESKPMDSNLASTNTTPWTGFLVGQGFLSRKVD